jgi:hypothetical protein
MSNATPNEWDLLPWGDRGDELPRLSLRTNTAHHATHYARDPNRACVYLLHGHQTAIQTPDWEALVSVFKQTRCTGCSDRTPRNGGTAIPVQGQAEGKGDGHE